MLWVSQLLCSTCVVHYMPNSMLFEFKPQKKQFSAQNILCSVDKLF